LRPISPVIPGWKEPLTRAVFAEHQPEYIALPAVLLPDGTVITRWRLTWAECFRLLRTRQLWLTILTFNHPLQPVKLDTICPTPGVNHG